MNEKEFSEMMEPDRKERERRILEENRKKSKEMR